jgi:AraC family transcriptional regulator
MLAPAPGLKASLGSGKVQDYDATPGMMVINPANVDSSLTWSTTRENVVIALTSESLLDLAAHEFDAGDVELQPPPFGTFDPWALTIAEQLKAELTRDEGGSELYVDSLITVFGVHLLRNYTTAAKRPPSPKGALPTRSVKMLREFLRENFTRALSVAELAAVCELPPRSFVRSFSKTFGEPPHQHLIKLRLAFAEKLLLNGNLTIAEVSHLSGFSSQSHLTSSMTKYRRLTPMQIRAIR